MNLVAALAGAMAFFALAPVASVRVEPPSRDAAGIARTYAAGGTANAPSISVQLTADRARMTVADRLVVSISVDAEPGATVTMPEVGDKLGDFTVASSEVTPSTAGSTGSTLRLVLEPFLSGAKSVPALTFRAIKNGKLTTVSSEPISIPVTDVLTLKKGQAPPIAPAKPPIDLIEPAQRRWPAILLGGLAAGAYVSAFGIARLSARRRRGPTDPIAAFRGVLDQANARCTPDAGTPTTLTALESVAGGLRTYLQQHLFIPAIGSSAPELVDRLRNTAHLPSDARAPLSRLIVDLDASRFAPDGANPDRARTLIAHALRILEATSTPTAASSSANMREKGDAAP